MTATTVLPPLLKSLSLTGLAVAVATSAFMYVASSDGAPSIQASRTSAPQVASTATTATITASTTSTSSGNEGINPQRAYQMEWPNNGTLFAPQSGDMIRGHTEVAGATLEIQVLDPDSQDPILENRWVNAGFPIVTSALVADSSLPSLGKPAYAWAVSATPANPPAFWTNTLANGGTLRIRALATSIPGGVNVADNEFDIDGLRCLQNQYALASNGTISWLTAANDCRTPFPVPFMTLGTKSTGATVLSANVVPNDLNRTFISMVYPTASLDSTNPEATGEAYYAATGAAATLPDFKARYGFSANETAPYTNGEVESRYYNKGDLGIGRVMHCRQFIIAARRGLACYVRNYANTNNPGLEPIAFGADETNYLSAALQKVSEQNFATVAMVQYDDSPQVDFSVYAHNIIVTPRPAPRPPLIRIEEPLSPIAQLDNHGANIVVPTNCLSCHGGQFDDNNTGTGVQRAYGARFLPFDSDPRILSFATGSLATSFPAYTQAAQAGNIRELNRLILEFAQTPSDEKKHITTMYGNENGITLGSTYIQNYLPSTWSATPASAKLYREVVKPYCIGCHVSWPRPGGYNFFADASSFANSRVSVLYNV